MAKMSDGRIYGFINARTVYTQSVHSFSWLHRLGCSFHNSCVVLEESHCTRSRPSKTRCTSAARKVLDVEDQELLRAAGLHVLCIPIAAITNVG